MRYFTTEELSFLLGEQIVFEGLFSMDRAVLVYERGYYWLGNYKATTVRIRKE